MNYLNITDKKNCTGCSACQNKCPNQAITMQEDTEGFLYPVIDQSKCTNCGLCEKACPILNSEFNDKSNTCYIAMSDMDTRMKSASGGAFSVIANYVLENGGYVAGAAFDNDWNVHHIIIDNKDDLDKLRRSKYVQSITGDIYIKVKDLLEKGKKVLFTGTPCQVAGLYSFLGAPYRGGVFANLITIDLICHGVPNNKVWQKYLNDNFDKSKILSINFREKIPHGWGCNTTTTTTEGILTNQSYMQGFLSALYYRPSCANCHFAKHERTSDFTLADFWSIGNYYPKYNDNKGTSFILVNTDKAKNITDKIKNNFALLEKFNHDVYDYADKCNASLIRSTKTHMNRDLFFKDLNETNAKFDDIIKRRLKKTYDIGVVGCSSGPNYGTNLTYYALYRTITDLGYSALMIDPPKTSRWHTYNRGALFKQDPYPPYARTTHFRVKDEMRVLNNYCDKFLTGSDQHERPSIYKQYCEYSLLDWVKDYKPKFGYAISFGLDYLDDTKDLQARMGYFINKYDKISVREKAAVKLCKDNFNIDTTFTLDPVFLPDKKIYYDLANKSTVETPNGYLLAHILEKKDELVKITESSGKNIKYIENAVFAWDKGILDIFVEDWLKYFINADFILTDSFHAVCFSIILGKQFGFFYNAPRGGSRMDTLIDCFGIKDRMVTSCEDLQRILNQKIDYDVINEKLSPLKEMSLNFLKDMLEMQPVKQSSAYDLLLDIYNDKQKNLVNEMHQFKQYLRFAPKKNYYKLKYSTYRILQNTVRGGVKDKFRMKKLKYKYLLEFIKRFENGI